MNCVFGFSKLSVQIWKSVFTMGWRLIQETSNQEKRFKPLHLLHFTISFIFIMFSFHCCCCCFWRWFIFINLITQNFSWRKKTHGKTVFLWQNEIQIYIRSLRFISSVSPNNLQRVTMVPKLVPQAVASRDEVARDWNSWPPDCQGNVFLTRLFRVK